MKNSTFFLVIALTVILTIILGYNLMMYDSQDIIKVFEDQIRIYQDNSLSAVTDKAILSTLHNDVSNEDYTVIEIDREPELVGTYTKDGEIISVKYKSYSGGHIALAIFIGMLFGMLIGMLLAFLLDFVISSFKSNS